MSNQHPRIAREKKTFEAMINIYCHGHHETKHDLCPDCTGLLEYAKARLDECPYEDDKTTCSKCPSNCFEPEMRERVRETMRYAGPRMMQRHPKMALQHLADSRRKEPGKSKGNDDNN